MSHIGLGKIILLGEHAVVYGFPALAAALDRGVRIDAVPTPAGGPLRVDVPTWNLKVTADDDHSFARGLSAIADAIELGRPPLTLVGDAQIPPGAGLGASAAFAVAISRALLTYMKKPATPAAVTEAASASESVLHGKASGVDVALAVHGGIGVFRKSTGLRPLQIPPLRVLVGPSGSPRSTAAMVERVAQTTSGSVDDPRLRELGSLTDTGTTALLAGNFAALGKSLDRAHELLGELGVSTPLLDGLCDQARAHGGYGAKLTGAGGGGAIIAIAPKDRENEILATWKTAGVHGFVAVVGGRSDSRVGDVPAGDGRADRRTGDGGGRAKPDPRAEDGGGRAKPDPRAEDGGGRAKPDPRAEDGGGRAKPDPRAEDGGGRAKPDRRDK